MEFLEDYPKIAKESEPVLRLITETVQGLQKADISSHLQEIEAAPSLEAKRAKFRILQKVNVPATVHLLEELLEKSKNGDKLEHLEWMSHRVHTAMSVESFSGARTFAEEAYRMAKEYYQSVEDNDANAILPRKAAYKAFIKACFDLIYVCRYQGKIVDAEMWLEEAKTVAADEEEYFDLNNLLILHGDLLLARGQLNNAIQNVLRLVDHKRSMNTENEPQEADNGLLYHKLGNAYRSIARWDLAKQYLIQSVQDAENQKDKVLEDDRIADLGSVYRAEGRIADAINWQTWHFINSFSRGDLWRLAVAWFNTGCDYLSVTPKPFLVAALKCFCWQHELAAQIGNEPLKGMALNYLGKVFCALRNYNLAAKVLTQAMDIVNETLDAAGEGMVLGNIGTLCRSIGELDDAIKYHKEYLLSASDRGDIGGCAEVQRELAIDYLCKGDLDNAEKQVRDALATLETIRNRLEGDDVSKIANFEKNQAEIYCLLQVTLARQGKHKEALALSELARTRALTDIIRDKIIQTTGITSPSWIYSSDFVSRWQDVTDEVLDDFSKCADELQTNFLIYSNVKDYDSVGTAQECLYIWVVLNKKSSKNDQRIHFRRIYLNEKINNKLLSGEQYFSKLKRAFRSPSNDGLPSQSQMDDTVKRAEMKPPQGKSYGTLLKDSYIQVLFSELENLTLEETMPSRSIENENAMCEELANDNDHGTNDLQSNTEGEDQEYRVRARKKGSWADEGIKELLQLYEVCIAPIDDCLPVNENGEAPNLTIIPHEFLFNVPFCCLYNGENRYLIERYVLNYAPSLRALLLLNQRLRYLKKRQLKRNIKVLAIGDPTMTESCMRELPSSGDEARNVQEIFGAEVCQVVVRNDATKQLFLQELKNTDILHVATHASPENFTPESTSFWVEENTLADYAMYGCLLLASSDGDKCNGEVKAKEISSENCISQLVMLSCCETGLGKVTGDGVVGLYRAFFAAGAASVIVTLWKIRDDVTTIFMEHFYRKFKETGNACGSLRSAMMYCIHEKKIPPQQWAPFSLIGALT